MMMMMMMIMMIMMMVMMIMIADQDDMTMTMMIIEAEIDDDARSRCLPRAGRGAPSSTGGIGSRPRRALTSTSGMSRPRRTAPFGCVAKSLMEGAQKKEDDRISSCKEAREAVYR
jgi:hypothetical protein